MIPTRQTVLHEPENGKHGNCFSAVIASLLHLPIEIIPTFCSRETWVRDVNAWLRPYGMCYIPLRLELGDYKEWLTSLGIDDLWHEIVGPSPRSVDVNHACVASNGAVVFDPHPSDAGLKQITSIGLFIPLQPWKARA